MRFPTRRALAAALFLAAPIGLTGCDEGAFEDAGEEIDEAAEEVEDEIDDHTRAALDDAIQVARLEPSKPLRAP